METLVSAVLPDITAEKREAIIKSLCRETNPHDDEKAEDCPSEILEVIKNMDTENRQHWKNVVEHAAKMLEKRMSEEVKKQVCEKYQKLARPSDSKKIATDKPPAAPRNTGPHKNSTLTKARTPLQFTSLLPAVSYLYLYWWPDKKTVQAQFKGGIEAEDQKSKSARWLDESMKEKSWTLKSVLTFVSFTCERMKPASSTVFHLKRRWRKSFRISRERSENREPKRVSEDSLECRCIIVRPNKVQ